MSSYLKCLMSPHYIGVEIQILCRALSGPYLEDWLYHQLHTFSPPAMLFLFQSSGPCFSYLCALVHAVPWTWTLFTWIMSIFYFKSHLLIVSPGKPPILSSFGF